ncbi:MAG: dihydrofolate reductase family protein [Candidatus Pacebacteria bacterium]|nr:dihydrofolate reductase family protein [Candidatus Paceibacterota bacterium]
MITLYNVVSKDGFIAGKDGNEDFIPDGMWNDFIDLCKKNDVLVMGRKTYDAIQSYPEELTGELENVSIRKVVITRQIDLSIKPQYEVITTVDEIPVLGENILISSGPTLNSAVIKAGIVDQIILNEIPVILAEGIPVFEVKPELELISTKEIDNSIQRRYKVLV